MTAKSTDRRHAGPVPTSGSTIELAAKPHRTPAQGRGDVVWFAALALLVLMAMTPAHAIFTEKPLQDPQEEARAQELMKELRCLVCQNQAISESGAPLARDMRVVLRERIAAGDSDKQAVNYMVERFGDWVLLNPPLKPKTYLLWFGVPIIFLIGATITFFYLRRRPGLSASGETGTSRPLTEEEQAELRRALTEKD